MISKVDKQIDNINSSLVWIKNNKPNDYKVKFINLVEQRRRLKVVRRASFDNPAIAAFGKSQVGKSYLMSCMLQKRDVSDNKEQVKAFTVKANNKEYDFIKEVNPIGDDKEATGVVTRFSSFKRSQNLYSEKYPVLVRCLSLIDIITVLCDSYFNDLHNYTTASESDIVVVCEELVAKYINMPDAQSPAITADEILGMKQYFKKHINNAQVFDNCSFFSEIALIIEKVPVHEYINVFRYLWNSDQNITKLFNRSLEILRRLEFSEYVYLPVESVLHEGIKENTVMSVECLKHLLDDNNNRTTEVLIGKDNGIRSLGTFTKSEVCAVAAEVIYKIDESFIGSTNRYCMDGVNEAVKAQVNKDDIKMTVLRDNDLLDFPGARSREKEDCNKLNENTILLYCFLRGKVAYLFNKYNESLLINVLLYCHHNKDNDVTDLWHLLDEWVRNNVGETTEKRKATLSKTKISPLFYCATMFNLDMKRRDSDVENSKSAIEGRWKGRFETVLNNQCFHRDSVEWVKNWSSNGEFFKNSYLLRDFKYSGIGESGLYDGFREHGKETDMVIPKDYYSLMRETFVKNNTVKELFENPEISWDLAATQNNDGSLYILENLKVVASSMDVARENLFNEKLSEVTRKVYDELKGYYVSTDKAEILKTNIRNAKNVFRELSFTCNIDNYYFGHLIQALQVTESQLYKIIHEEVMRSSEILSAPNNFDKYEIIRKDCENNGHPLSKCISTNEFWDALINTYAFSNREDAEEFLVRKGVDYKLLFEVKSNKSKNNSDAIAEHIYDSWCEKIKSVSFNNMFTEDNAFNSSVMANLIDNIIETSKRIKLSELMATAISDYVNVVDIHVMNESFIADILADIINDFILDLGYSTYSDEKIRSIKSIAESHNLPIYKYIDKDEEIACTEEMLTNLFNSISSNPLALIPSFEENYYKWVEYMYISYIAHLDVPNFNLEVNDALKSILVNLKSVAGEA